MEIANLIRTAEKESTVFFIRAVSENTGNAHRYIVQELSRRDAKDVQEILGIVKKGSLSGEALWRLEDIYSELVSIAVPTGWFESRTKYELGSIIEKDKVKITPAKERSMA